MRPHRITTTAALATLLLAAAPAKNPRAADLLLHERVIPSGSIVRLGEVAAVRRAKPSEAARLAALPLMPSPAPGTEQIVRGQQIRDLLEAHGVDLMDIRFDGATRVTIGRQRPPSPPVDAPAAPEADAVETSPEASANSRQQIGFRLVTEAPPKPGARPRTLPSVDQTTAAAASLRDSLNAYVRGRLADDFVRVRDVLVTPRNAASLAEATNAVAVSTTEQLVIGKQRFLVAFPTAAGSVRFPVYATVERIEPVVVAAAPIARGALITHANTRLTVLEDDYRLRPGESLHSDRDAAIGLEAARSLSPGQPLTDANCLPPTMVRRGDVVDVTAGSAGVTVRMKATARGDGRRGEIVEVEALDDRRRLEARVTGYGELAVMSGSRRGATNRRRTR